MILKALGAVLPVAAIRPRGRQRWDRAIRVVVWIEAGILTLYGFVLITIGLLVQAHVIHAFATADHRALAWHAYLWDPWFLIWGLLAIGVLRAAARPPPLRCVRIGGVLGLPADIHALLFDLDGVLTPTAKVHAAAWKQTFDEFLRQRAQETNSEFVPFDEVADYDEYVDGKPREDGVRSFLNSRGVELPEGTADDPTDAATVHGVGNNKNERVLKLIHEQGVQPYEGSARYVRAAKQAGLKRAVVSSSANCRDVLASAGIDDLFDAVVDGVVATREHLHGKPAPDTFLAGAKALGVEPAHAAVFEDALAGVEAGRAGKFGFVVGVDRVGQRDALKEHGADVVVDDLADLLDS